MNTAKVIGLSSLLTVLLGCSKVHTVTDNVTLYPANANAQQWGILRFYSQYQSNSLPSGLQVRLPNGELLNGQITYVEDSGTTDSDSDGFWDNVRIGVGVGHRVGRHGSWGIGMSSLSHSRYRSDKQKVNINAFTEKLSMNCQGEFDRKQKTGTIACQLTNGMQYSGTLRRVTTPSAK